MQVVTVVTAVRAVKWAALWAAVAVRLPETVCTAVWAEEWAAEAVAMDPVLEVEVVEWAEDLDWEERMGTRALECH